MFIVGYAVSDGLDFPFPLVYASVFSGFYLAVMLSLMGFIFRAAAVEPGNEDKGRKRWNFGFLLGSALPALFFGFEAGNIAAGLPLDSRYDYTAGLLSPFNPYSLVLGVLGLTAFLMQGVSYAMMKSGGARAKEIFTRIWPFLLVLLPLGGLYSYWVAPSLFDAYRELPLLYMIPLVSLLGVVLARRAANIGRYGLAFLGSSLAVSGMLLTLAICTFSLPGVPIVLIYTTYVYRVFHGKVNLNRHGY